MTIEFELFGETKKIIYDGFSYMPINVYMGKDKHGNDKIHERAIGYC